LVILRTSRGRAGGRTPAPPRPILLLVAVLVAGAACAGPGVLSSALPASGSPPAGAVVDFSFARDTFAFPNEIRARHPGVDDLYANHCFVLARAVRQFLRAARFDPTSPRLTGAEYAERVRRVSAVPPWGPPLPRDDRVVIPGYPGLRAFTAAEEPAVKAGLGGRFWTLVHWTNWRVTRPVTGGHQEAVAAEIVAELRDERLVQLLVTNWPKPELNHTVVAFAWRSHAQGIDLDVWDPNDPGAPGTITFDRVRRLFSATRLYDTEPGTIRVFRMYYSRWL
jgi:hypothetical protein